MPVFLEEAAYTLPPAAMCLGPTTPCRAVARYLNATTTRGPFDDLAAMMAASRGKLLVEVVEMLSGKNVPGKVRPGGTVHGGRVTIGIVKGAGAQREERAREGASGGTVQGGRVTTDIGRNRDAQRKALGSLGAG